MQELNGIKDNAKMNDFKMKNKIYEMIIYASPCLDQFPRSEKYALAQDIRKTMYKILRLVVMLENKHYKKTTLGDLDTEVDVLRHLIRLAADNRLLRTSTVSANEEIRKSIKTPSRDRKNDRRL